MPGFYFRITLLASFFATVLFAPHFVVAQSGVVLNEICPTNVSGLINTKSGEYDDWIEIRNTNASQHYHLKDWGLTDDPSNPQKFRFPDIELYPGEMLVVFTADNDETRTINHWEKATSDNGWSYYYNSLAPDTNWRNIGFTSQGWLTDPQLPCSGSTSGRMAIAAIKNFNISDKTNILQGALHVDYDDGYVVYINGIEISRYNLGTAGSRPLWNEGAREKIDAKIPQGLQPDSIFLSYELLQRVLVNGQNVIAIESHTQVGSSDVSAAPYLFFGVDTSATVCATNSFPVWFRRPLHDFMNANFKLSRSGETVYLYNNAGYTEDSFTFPAMESNNSFGRCGNGTIWSLFATPTPNAANSASVCYLGYAFPPVFNKTPGFYPSSIQVEIDTTIFGGEVHYTLNGNTPTLSSPRYTGPLQIDTATTIRARTFKSNYLPSPLITNSYLINQTIDLPVFTITTDSSNLWDWNTGIYVLGPNASSSSPYKGANFWQDWSKPASIEFYNKQKNRLFNFNAEIEIYGNYSRAKPQKSFNIKLEDSFGTGSIKYNFITDKPQLDETDDIVLRNAGTDWNKVHFRDVFMERVMKNTYSGYIAAEPTCMYLNGQFWGVYSIHENHDENWQQFNWGYDVDEINYLKEDGSTITLKEGTDSLWWDIYNYATTQSPLTSTYYDYLDQRIDFKNYADYFIVQTFVNNGDWIGDWTNNIKFWSPRKPGGKLRYLVYDLDMGFGYGGASAYDNRLSMAIDPSSFCHSSEIFDKVTDNPTFKQYFINRYADLINTIFQEDSLDRVMYGIRDSMTIDMPEHFAKWGSNMSTWANYIDDMQDYYSRRPSIVRNQIQSEFGMTGQITLSLNVSPANAGRILISTIIPSSYPWSGVYFNGNPVTIIAVPNPGYSFDHFTSTNLGANNTNGTNTVNFTSSQTITAYFTGSPATPRLYFSELNYNADGAADCGDWVEIYNNGNIAIDLTDWELRDEKDYHRFIVPNGTVIQPNEYLVVAEDLEKFNALFPSVTNVIGPTGFNFGNDGDQLRLLDYRNLVIDSVYYQDAAPWPLLADGGGYTCERAANPGNPYDGNNWFAGCLGGSPGRAFTGNLGVPVTITGNTNFCNGGTVYLQATDITGFAYQWYRNGVPLQGATASSLTATQSGTYTTVVTYQGCAAVSDTVVVSQVSQNAPPQVADVTRCGNGTVTLTAIASDTVYWFNSVGGIPLAVGDTFVTPNVSANTVFYAQTSLSCPSQTVAVQVTVLPQATSPSVVDFVKCGPGAVTLTATDTAVIRWYNSAVGGGLLNIGDTFSIPFLANDTSFFLEAGSVCPSNRVAMNITVQETSTPTASDGSRCGSGAVILQSNSPDPVAWYDAPVGGNMIGQTLNLITGLLLTTDTFYVQSNGVCPSARVPAIATINPIPPQPIVSDTTICSTGAIVLTATSPEQVYWFTTPSSSTTPIYTGPVFNTNLQATNDTIITYYLEAGYICRSSPRVPLRVTYEQVDQVNLGPDIVLSSGQSTILTANVSAASFLWSTGETTPAIVVTTSDTFSVLCTYPNGCTTSDEVAVTFVTGLEEPATVVVTKGIFPNPANDHAQLVVYAKNKTNVTIELLDISGRVVWSSDYSASIGLNQMELSFANIASGSYHLRILSKENISHVEKLIIQK